MEFLYDIEALDPVPGAASRGLCDDERAAAFLSARARLRSRSSRRCRGYVVVGYDVSVDGQVGNVHVIESNPPGVFDAAAVAAVGAWRFAAPVVGGEAQSAPGRKSRVEFKLGAGDEYER
jgi:protein TonB